MPELNPGITLAYGKKGLELVPGDDWNMDVVQPGYHEAIVNPGGKIAGSLQRPIGCPPLKDLATWDKKVGIIFNDITRPTPNRLIIESILKELRHIPPGSVTLFNALGTHRENSESELREMLGDHLVDHYRIVQNNSTDKSSQVLTGRTSSGNEVWLNREMINCDLRILTGFIEPHFFAGFSGGGKAIMPGMAGMETILKNHGAQNIGNPKASYGVTDGNPVWKEVREIMSMTGDHFLLNITLNRDKEVTAVFSGDPVTAHDLGVDYVRKTAMVPLSVPYDVVVTTNSGYPLDLNLYQTVKGISAAARVVKEGGTIIAAAECWDGIPEHGHFGQLLREYPDPEHLLERINTPGFSMPDQWQAQILARILLKSELFLFSGNLTDEQLAMAGIRRCHDITALIESLRRKKGPEISICIMPEGPQTIPYISE